MPARVPPKAAHLRNSPIFQAATIAPRAGWDSWPRWVVVVACLLVAVHLFLALLWAVPGYLCIDEVIYHQMARDFAATGSLALRTGYSDLPNVELIHEHFMRLRGGATYSQYPPLFAVLAGPLYGFLGLRSLILLNALAFLGVVALTAGMAARAFPDRRVAALSAAILVFCGFSWDYSQAAWSHATAVLFTTAAAWLGMAALDARRPKSLALAGLAGLAGGLGLAVRLDAVPALAAVTVAFFLVARPARALEAGAVLLGAAPAFVALSAVNRVKFGTLSPFSYGATAHGYQKALPFAAAGVAVLGLAIAFVASRARKVTGDARPRWTIAAAVLAIAAACLAPARVRDGLPAFGRSFMNNLVESRTLDAGVVAPAMVRTPDGGVVYIGALKKSVLQSLPYLALLAVPAVALLTRNRVRGTLAWLLMFPAGWALLDAGFDFQGGLCLNMRYFLPALPFTSILAAWSLMELVDRARPHRAILWLAGGGLAAAAIFFSSVRSGLPIESLEKPLLSFPLVLGGLLLVCVLGSAASGAVWRERMAAAAASCAAAGLVWSGLVAFLYDVPHHRRQRENNLATGLVIAKSIPPGSTLFTAPYIDPVMKVLDTPDVWVAFPAQDGFEGFPVVLDGSLARGRRSFALFPAGLWGTVDRRWLAGYRVTPVRAFDETFECGPTLRDAGAWAAAPRPPRPDRFVLAEITRRVTFAPAEAASPP
jgi:4-amino-4-deoxy-L-arabinose transferase-like glycosyltransferase